MTKRRRLACIAAAALTVGAAPEPADYVVEGDGVVSATIEGAPGRLRIDPGAPSLPIVNDAFRLAAGLKPGMFGATFKVGPVQVRGASAVADLVVAGMPVKRRILWFDRPFVAGADGAVGPGTLPAPVVRFAIHAPRPGERTVELPLVDAGFLVGTWGELFAEVVVGGEPIKVRFDLHHAWSLASAPTGQRVAKANGGALTGPIEQTEIAFGVMRPVRRMKLARPLAIGPLTLDSVRVRVSDYGNAAAIPDADAVPDPDEIVVTGKKKRKGRERLSIGRDQLERCSSLTFDKVRKVVRLSCI